MTVKTQKRMTRRAAIAAALLGATLVLPGTAVADHDPNNIRNPYTCDPAVADDCPHFETDFSVRVQNPVKNQNSAVQFRFDQPDRRMPVIRADYYLPTGWRFGGLSNLRPSAHASCTPAHNANGTLNQTELISADTGMLLMTDSVRADDPSNEQEAVDALFNKPVSGGPAGPDPAFRYGIIPGHQPSVSFLSWDGTTAKLCVHQRHNQPSGAPTPPQVTFILEATLTRLATDPNFDWRLSVDYSSITKDPEVMAGRGSVLENHLALGAMTAGNWNQHPVTGAFQKVPFSRTPLDPGAYPFKADLFTCAEGLNAAHVTGCKNGGFVSQTLSQLVNITPAPDTSKFEFARLSGPATPGLCANSFCPLALIRGTNQFDVTWAQPPLVDGQEVRGYALTLAMPGNQQSRKFYRLVTDPDTPGFDASVCGPAGGDPNCTFHISLPVQSSDGSTTLTPDKKYHLSLVTIYSDGRRTDLTCDDLTGEGVACPASMPRLNRQEPGESTWQVLMRPEEWPRAFVDTYDDSSNSTHDPITNYLLLVDCALKEAELVVWNTNDKVSSFRSTSNLIACDNTPQTPGLVSISNGTSGGATRNWVVAAELDPPIPGSGATGLFLSYNIKNPGLNPPTIAGWPEIGQPGCESIDPTEILSRSCIWFFAVEI